MTVCPWLTYYYHIKFYWTIQTMHLVVSVNLWLVYCCPEKILYVQSYLGKSEWGATASRQLREMVTLASRSWCYDGQCKNHIAFWKVHFHFPFCPRHCIIASSVDCEEVSAWSIAWPIGCLIHSSWAASHWLVVNCGSGSFQPRVHGNMDESEGNDWTSLFQICDCDGGVFFRNMIRFLTIKIQKNSVYPCT